MTPRAPHELDLALGARIRERRRRLGLSQEALAAAAGLSFQQIQKYECGENRITVSRLVTLAGGLNCRVSDLIEGLETETLEEIETATVARLLAVDFARDLLEAYFHLPPGHRRIVVQHARALVEATRQTETG